MSSQHLLCITPDHRLTPSIAKIRKKKIAKERTPPSYPIDYSKVPTRVLIEGTVVKFLKGLKSLKVLRPDTLPIVGVRASREVITTVKSSQFQAFLR